MSFHEAFPGPRNQPVEDRTTMGTDKGEGLERGRTTEEVVDSTGLKDEWDNSSRQHPGFEEDVEENVTGNKDMDDRDEYPSK